MALTFVQKLKRCQPYLTKINDKDIQLYDAVFLKKQQYVSFTYEPELNKLVEEGHRFLILWHFGKKYDCCGISLLSTSRYLNQNKGLGIRLFGQYGNKPVYLDYDRIWVIKLSCIDSLAYSLYNGDHSRLNSLHLSTDSNEIKVLPGLIDSGIVKKELMDYRLLFHTKFRNSDLEDESNKELLIQTCENLTNEAAKQWCENILGKDIVNKYINMCLAADCYKPYIFNDFLLLTFKTLDKTGRRIIANDIRRGYADSGLFDKLGLEYIELGRT